MRGRLSENKMYDLHGFSEARAEMIVNRAFREANTNGLHKIRFITGLGNHINSKGKRGTLFKEFPTWLKNSKYGDRIEVIQKHSGHYVVYLSQVELDDRRSKYLKNITDNFLKENLSKIKTAAENNNPEMMCVYAKLLEEGLHTKQNIPLAVKFVKKAADAGYPPGMHEYARYWLHGIGIKQSDKKAKQWLWKAHKAGYIPSTATLATRYEYERDIDKAIELHTIAADAGSTASMCFFGTIYLVGNHVELSETKSFEWYTKAADKGDVKAQHNLAAMLSKGVGCVKNLSESERYLSMSANAGDAEAQFQYSMALLIKGDNEQGFMWLSTAADNGSEQANAYMCTLSEDSDFKKEYLQRSANAGNLLSKIKLDKLNGIYRTVEEIPLSEITEMFMLLDNNDVINMDMNAKYLLLDKILLEAKPKYKQCAYEYLQQLARGRCPYALRRIAYFHARGDGALAIKKRICRVVELLQTACDLDDSIAMLKLGLHYQRDKGNSESIAKAKYLIRKSVKNKYPPAFYFLGNMYEQGFFGKNKLHVALLCYKNAVKYGRLEEHVAKFVMGPLDEYESVLKLAELKVLELAQKIKVTRSTNNTSAIKIGFFDSQNKHGPQLNQKIESPNSQKKPLPPQKKVTSYNKSNENTSEEKLTYNSFFGSFFSTRNLAIAATAIATAWVLLYDRDRP